MKKIKGLLNLIIAPIKNKYKLQRRCNTLEIQKESLENIIQSRVSETLMNILANQDEVERLRKENKRLRTKVKELKEDLRGEK